MSTGSGRLIPKCAAKLLLAAAAVDLAFVSLLAKLAADISYFANWGKTIFGGSLDSREIEIATIFLMMPPLLALYWLITELLFSGHSIGRAALQIAPRTEDGAPLGFGRKSKRCFLKMITFGLTGCSPVSAAVYDRKSGVVWHSPMAPERQRKMRDWGLRIKNGNNATGDAMRLIDVAVKAENGVGEIRIGRDKNWATIALVGDLKVSNRHCVIRVTRDGLMIRDQNSNNKTFVGGKPIPPQHPVNLRNHSAFKVGDIVISIER